METCKHTPPQNQWSVRVLGAFVCLQVPQKVLPMDNVERFLAATAPCVPASVDGDFRLRELFSSLEEVSAYGATVPLMLGPLEVSQFYAPSLSALRLLEACRKGGPPRLLLELNERAPPFARKPLSEALAELSSAACPDLGALSTASLNESSFISIFWQPVSRIPLGPLLRDIAASFVTYHLLCTTGGGEDAPACCGTSLREALRQRVSARRDANVAVLPAVGLLGLKVEANIWGNSRLVADMEAETTLLLTRLGFSDHADYLFFCQPRRDGGSG